MGDFWSVACDMFPVKSIKFCDVYVLLIYVLSIKINGVDFFSSVKCNAAVNLRHVL